MALNDIYFINKKWQFHVFEDYESHDEYNQIYCERVLIKKSDNSVNFEAFRITYHIDELLQKRRNSIANALELRLSRTKPSICIWSRNYSFGLGHATVVYAVYFPSFLYNGPVKEAFMNGTTTNNSLSLTGFFT